MNHESHQLGFSETRGREYGITSSGLSFLCFAGQLCCGVTKSFSIISVRIDRDLPPSRYSRGPPMHLNKHVPGIVPHVTMC